MLEFFTLIFFSGLVYTNSLLSNLLSRHITRHDKVESTLKKYKYTLLVISVLHFLLLPLMLQILQNINAKNEHELFFTYLYYLPICFGGLQITSLLCKTLYKQGITGIISVIAHIIYAVGFTIYALTGFFYNINFLSDFRL